MGGGESVCVCGWMGKEVRSCNVMGGLARMRGAKALAGGCERVR